MSQDTDEYDVFFSYAHTDNRTRWISGFIEALCHEHRQFFGGRELRYFFDEREIRPADSWEITLHTKLARSRLFVAFLSPNYFLSTWCRREWQAWLEQEIAKHQLSVGTVPIYTVAVPGWDTAIDEATVARNIVADNRWAGTPDEFASAVGPLVRQMRRRQYYKVHSYFDEGLDAFRQDQLRADLKNLAQEIERRAAQVRIAGESPSNVPPYNRFFTGRLEELVDLRKTMTDRRTGVITVINGLGGMGKTELALTYAHAFAAVYPGGRFYLRCEGKKRVTDALLDLLSVFHAEISEADRSSRERSSAAILWCLRRRVGEKGPVLVILDHVTSPQLLRGVETDSLTQLGPGLHMLATTRQPARPLSHLQWKTVDRLDEPAALELLEKKRSLVTPQDREAAEQLVRDLGGYPLAIELVSSWLAARPSVSVSDFLTRWRGENIRTLPQLAEETPDQRRQPSGSDLTSVLAPTMAELSSLSRRILEYATCWHPDQVPAPWLKSLVEAEGLLASTQPGYESPWDASLRELEQFGLWSPAEKESRTVLRLHRFVQQWLSRRIPVSKRKTFAIAVDTMIRNVFADSPSAPTDSSRRWELPVLEALAERWRDLGRPGTGWLLGRVGQRWMLQNEWSRAERPLRHAVEWHELQAHPEVEQQVRDLLNLAENTRVAGRWDEAGMLMDRAVQLDARLKQPNHPLASTLLVNRAQLDCDLQQWSRAEQLAQQALATEEADHGMEHPDLIPALNLLARVCRQQHRFEDAIVFLRRAMAIAAAAFPANDLEVLPLWNNLAALELERGRHNDAEVWLQKALEVDRRLWGPRHPLVATTLNNLAMVYRARAEAVAAVEALRQALEINEETFGTAHPHTLRTMNNLADVLRETGQVAEALATFRTVLQAGEKTWGTDHPEQATTATNLARLLVDLGTLDEARTLAEEALKVRQHSLGESHPLVARTWDVLCRVHAAAGRSAEARQCGASAVAILRVACGNDHPWTVAALEAFHRAATESPAS